MAWFRARFGQEPDYGRLLELVAPTAAERQAVLRGYFAPTDEPRPVAPSHRALARLVSDGVVRVVVTLNFDHLIEDALRAEGVEPAVVSREEQFASMLPLHAQSAVVVHLHGDWADPTSLLNTAEELAGYGPSAERLMMQVADEYGLVLVGWSSSWDVALRRLLAERTNPFFSTWWYDPFPLSEAGQQLAVRRPAVHLPAAAGEALPRLRDAVAVTAGVARSVPMNPQVAAAGVRRGLQRPSGAAAVADELAGLVDQLRRHPILLAADFRGPDPTSEAIRRMERFEQDSQVLLAVAGQSLRSTPAAAEWCTEAIPLLTVEDSGEGWAALLELQNYPATLLFHLAGVALVLERRWSEVARLLREVTVLTRDGSRQLASRMLLPERTTPFANASSRLFGVLQETFVIALGVGQQRWEEAWELFEYLALVEEADARLSAEDFAALHPAVSEAWMQERGGSVLPGLERTAQHRQARELLRQFSGAVRVAAPPHLRTLGVAADFRPRVSSRLRDELAGGPGRLVAPLLEAGFGGASRDRLLVVVALVDDLLARVAEDGAYRSAAGGVHMMRSGVFWIDQLSTS